MSKPRYRHPLAKALLTPVEEPSKPKSPEAFGVELKEQAARMGQRLEELKARSARIEGDRWRTLLADVKHMVRQTEELTELLKDYQARAAEVDTDAIVSQMQEMLEAAGAPQEKRPGYLDGPLKLSVTGRDPNGDIQEVLVLKADPSVVH